MKNTLLYTLFVGILFALFTTNVEASFWYECKYTGIVQNVNISNASSEKPDIQIDLSILKSELKRGHITDRTCGFTKGDPLQISTLPTEEDARQRKKNPGRSIQRAFLSPEHDIESIRVNDRITVDYSFFNSGKGDTHTYTLLKLKHRKPKKIKKRKNEDASHDQVK